MSDEQADLGPRLRVAFVALPDRAGSAACRHDRRLRHLQRNARQCFYRRLRLFLDERRNRRLFRSGLGQFPLSLKLEAITPITYSASILGSLFYEMDGVRMRVPNHTRFQPFGQGLFGGVHGFDSYFPDQVGKLPTSYDTSFALALGGGLDIAISKHIWIRAVQADYFYSELRNLRENRQNQVRLGAGSSSEVAGNGPTNTSNDRLFEFRFS